MRRRAEAALVVDVWHELCQHHEPASRARRAFGRALFVFLEAQTLQTALGSLKTIGF